MKFYINQKKIILIVSIILLIILTYRLYDYFKPVKIIYHKGQVYEFRDDIKEASKIPVYPNEEWVYDMFWDIRTGNVTILFKPMDSRTNGYYRLEVFELVNKLTTMYKTIPIFVARTGSDIQPVYLSKKFDAQPIESYENITRENNVLKIILVPPGIANETYVRAGGNKIFIYGKDFRGLDLATIRTILVAMEFKPE